MLNQSDASGFTIELPIFSGPLELLLHLVQKEQVSIWDVSLAKVTAEYMGYLETMQELNLDITCEFLVIAATLLQIKARSLLPKPTVTDGPEETDSQEQLILRLIEYKKYKLAAETFEARGQQQATVFTKVTADPALVLDQPTPVWSDCSGVSLWELVDIMQELLEQNALATPVLKRVPVPRKQISLNETIIKLQQRFQKGYRCSFQGLMQEAENKAELIVTFLASLELIRLGLVQLTKSSTNEILLLAPEG